MRLERTGAREYALMFPQTSHVFNSVAFTELNRGKCDDIHYLFGLDDHGKVRLGITLGERDDSLRSPFSAPFGGVEQTKAQNVEFYLGFAGALKDYGVTLGKEVRLTLPPLFYDCGGNIAKLHCALLTQGARAVTEYNYHYPLDRFGGYIESLSTEARKKFRKGERSGFNLEILTGSASDVARAYGVIKANRDSHGYPLRMSLEDVMATARVIKATFMVMSRDGEDVAAVQAFDVAPGIVQIIYWGDAPGYSALRPMRFLPYKVFEYFSSAGKMIVDVGPSSTDGIPSVGLCDFKEDVGCVLTPKTSFVL